MDNIDRIPIVVSVMRTIMEERHWSLSTYQMAQIGKLAEEVGEAIKEANIIVGNSRHANQYFTDLLGYELADVIITAYCMAEAFEITVDNFIEEKINRIKLRGGY